MQPHSTLISGPLPPPVGGAAVSFQTFLEAWRHEVGEPGEVVNTAASYLKTSRRLRAADVVRGVRIAGQLWAGTRRHDTVLAFCTTGFFLRYAAFLGHLRRQQGCRVVLSFFGGKFSDTLAALPSAERKSRIAQLRALDGVVVETRYIHDHLREMGVGNVVQIPGYRRIDHDRLPSPSRPATGPLRVAFVSQVRREKGVLDLLEGIRLAQQAGHEVHCDLYGPVVPELEEELRSVYAGLRFVHYRGIAGGSIPALLAGYDLLALPTWHEGEGHPGVVIEAMMAGIPVLATRFRSLPELVTPGQNGMLVEPRAPHEVMEALTALAADRPRLAAMGDANRARIHDHDVVRAVHRVHALVTASPQLHAA